MSTNKTRIAVVDYSSGNPQPMWTVLEFEIYKEALEYVETTMAIGVAQGIIRSVQIYVYSYDNPSYRYWVDGTGNKYVVEEPFPQSYP